MARPHQKSVRTLRSVVLLGVLFGLFFSSGEGVRLLPIPTSDPGDHAAGEIDRGRQSDVKYSYSVGRMGTNLTAGKHKVPRKNFLDHADALNALPLVIDRQRFAVGSAGPAEHADAIQSIAAVLPPPGRAPPSV